MGWMRLPLIPATGVAGMRRSHHPAPTTAAVRSGVRWDVERQGPESMEFDDGRARHMTKRGGQELSPSETVDAPGHVVSVRYAPQNSRPKDLSGMPRETSPKTAVFYQALEPRREM